MTRAKTPCRPTLPGRWRWLSAAAMVSCAVTSPPPLPAAHGMEETQNRAPQGAGLVGTSSNDVRPGVLGACADDLEHLKVAYLEHRWADVLRYSEYTGCGPLDDADSRIRYRMLAHYHRKEYAECIALAADSDVPEFERISGACNRKRAGRGPQ